MIAYYDKYTGAFDMGGDDFTVLETVRYFLGYTGHLKEGESSFLTERAEEEDYSNWFSGEFTAFLYDKNKKALTLQEHLLGGRTWIYVLNAERYVYFSSSLKEIRRAAGMKFVLNEAILPHFLYNGFLYGKHTLICGIYKLEPGSRICFDKSAILQHTVNPVYQEDSETGIEDAYKEVIGNAIAAAAEKQLKMRGRLDLTLSAGFDSNCILHYVRNAYPNEEIHCYSIGGIKGVDETATAQRIAAEYENIDFRKGFVTPDTRSRMEEIVERLEGSVYERGIFLQYELARLLTQNRCKSIICGECADQIFHKKFYENIPEDNFLFDYEHHPRQMAAYVVKAKNRLMMNSFGIEVYYPFLNEQVIGLGYRLRNKNGTQKIFHKQMCKELLPENISIFLEKQGGSTALDALFEEGTDVRREMRRSPFYSEDFRITQKYPREEAEKDYYLTLIYLETFQKLFCC